jgi:hypothetical protein
MPQTTRGLILGSPGPIPSPSIAILYGSGAPTSLTVDPTQVNVNNCANGSLYIDYSTPALWFKGAGWQQVTIP